MRRRRQGRRASASRWACNIGSAALGVTTATLAGTARGVRRREQGLGGRLAGALAAPEGLRAGGRAAGGDSELVSWVPDALLAGAGPDRWQHDAAQPLLRWHCRRPDWRRISLPQPFLLLHTSLCRPSYKGTPIRYTHRRV